MSKTWIIVIVVIIVIVIVALFFLFGRGEATTYIPTASTPPASTTRKRPLIITEALYGCDMPTCVKKNVTAILQGYVKDDAILIAPAFDGQHYNKIFGGDPAPNINKTLEVKYNIAGIDGYVQIDDSAGLFLNI